MQLPLQEKDIKILNDELREYKELRGRLHIRVLFPFFFLLIFIAGVGAYLQFSTDAFIVAFLVAITTLLFFYFKISYSQMSAVKKDLKEGIKIRASFKAERIEEDGEEKTFILDNSKTLYPKNFKDFKIDASRINQETKFTIEYAQHSHCLLNVELVKD